MLDQADVQERPQVNVVATTRQLVVEARSKITACEKLFGSLSGRSAIVLSDDGARLYKLVDNRSFKKKVEEKGITDVTFPNPESELVTRGEDTITLDSFELGKGELSREQEVKQRLSSLSLPYDPDTISEENANKINPNGARDILRILEDLTRGKIINYRDARIETFLKTPSPSQV